MVPGCMLKLEQYKAVRVSHQMPSLGPTVNVGLVQIINGDVVPVVVLPALPVLQWSRSRLVFNCLNCDAGTK